MLFFAIHLVLFCSFQAKPLQIVLFHDPYEPLAACQAARAKKFTINESLRVAFVQYGDHKEVTLNQDRIFFVTPPVYDRAKYEIDPMASHMAYLDAPTMHSYTDIVCIAECGCMPLIAITDAQTLMLSEIEKCHDPTTADGVAHALTMLVQSDWQRQYDAYKQRRNSFSCLDFQVKRYPISYQYLFRFLFLFFLRLK
jgi:hypothetical protein